VKWTGHDRHKGAEVIAYGAIRRPSPSVKRLSRGDLSEAIRKEHPSEAARNKRQARSNP